MDEPMVPAIVLVEIQRQLADLQSTITTLTSRLIKKGEEIERLNQLLLSARRTRFGQSSEKSVYVLSDSARQLSLLAPQALAWYRHQIRQTLRFFPRRAPDPLCCDLN